MSPLKFEKCEFAKSSIMYLIHIVSADEIRADLSRLQAINQIQQPKDVGDIRRFHYGEPTGQVYSKLVDSDSATEGSAPEEESVNVGTESTACV